MPIIKKLSDKIFENPGRFGFQYDAVKQEFVPVVEQAVAPTVIDIIKSREPNKLVEAPTLGRTIAAANKAAVVKNTSAPAQLIDKKNIAFIIGGAVLVIMVLILIFKH